MPNNDTRSIGVFDSGVGGLTVVKALTQVLPHETYLYYGDVAHLPYGDKSPSAIRGYLKRIFTFFKAQNVKAIVVACNTASAVLDDTLLNLCAPLPLFEVISPAVEAAVAYSQNQHIGVIGTKTTINAHSYRSKILTKNPNALVIEKATPLLVPMIENEPLDSPIIPAVVEAYLSDTGFSQIDTLILGCTHYPLLSTIIKQYLENNFEHSVEIISSSATTAQFVAKSLIPKQNTQADAPTPQSQFFVSDFTPNFQEIAQLFFGRGIALSQLPFEDLPH